MSEQTTPVEAPAPAPPEHGKPRRDTVLLSEVPDPAALAAPPDELAVPGPQGGSDSQRGTESGHDSGHGSGALAVLSRRYQILAEVGRGDLCVVYKTHDKETGSTVALKLLRSDVSFDPASLESFKSDVLLARGITHPNICRIYEVHFVNGTACVTMHFVEGESLRSLLNRVGSLPLRKGIDLTLQICAGLAEAHGFGIVHGDLKPENLMIGPHGTAKITDFLFAPLLQAARQITGAPAPASLYRAPERAGGKSLDRRADIYSLGIVLHELFTGKLPALTGVPGKTSSNQASNRPDSLRDADTAIPVSLERVILKCLEENPAKRYQTVAELESDLSSSGLRAILPSGGGIGTRTTLANREAIAHPDAVPLSTPRPLPYSHRFSRRSAPIIGILLGTLAILTVLGVLHVTSNLRMARRLAPPSAIYAPHPPASALDKSTPVSSRSQFSMIPIPAFDEIPATSANAGPPNASPESSGALDDVAPGAGKAASQGPASRDSGGTNYLWMGRFDLQSGAQEMVNEIEGLGLPAVIVPRHNPKDDFFVVLSGPFSPSKASAALDELQAEGFANIHLIKNLTLNQ